MERKASYWHVLILGLIVAVINEGVHYFINTLLLKGSEPFWAEVVTFIIIVVVVATVYLKVYLKKKSDDE